jgi:hypothetical protein
MMLCIPGFTLSYQKLINHFNVELSSIHESVSESSISVQLSLLFHLTLISDKATIKACRSLIILENRYSGGDVLLAE